MSKSPNPVKFHSQHHKIEILPKTSVENENIRKELFDDKKESENFTYLLNDKNVHIALLRCKTLKMKMGQVANWQNKHSELKNIRRILVVPNCADDYPVCQYSTHQEKTEQRIFLPTFRMFDHFHDQIFITNAKTVLVLQLHHLGLGIEWSLTQEQQICQRSVKIY